MLQPVCNWDLAKAMCLALTTQQEIRGEIIILSTNYSIRLIDYLEIVKAHLNSTSQINWVDADEFQLAHPEHTGLKFLREHMCFSIDKAHRLLGYKPDYTPEQGLKKSLQWCTDNGVF
jgi:nucleoside-diphosphate-sugar epimerase